MACGRVLLADSHLNMLGSVYSLLDAMFETVLMVADEPSLLDAVETIRPDLVVVDLSLPGASEANVARRLLSRHPGLRVIVLSVHDEPCVVELMRESGVAGFVLKRAAGRDLIQAIKHVLGGGTYLCPEARDRHPQRDESPAPLDPPPARAENGRPE